MVFLMISAMSMLLAAIWAMVITLYDVICERILTLVLVSGWIILCMYCSELRNYVTPFVLFLYTTRWDAWARYSLTKAQLKQEYFDMFGL
jgi:hypothetical protein